MNRNSLKQFQMVLPQFKAVVPTAPLPDPIGQNIETIIALHTRAEKGVARHQRIVESITAFFGRPAFLYSIILIVVLWILPNVLPQHFVPRFDPPPFEGLEQTIGIGSLLMTTGVLIRQNRQEKLAEQRAQLSLQLSLLSEQKIAKLIALMEELRYDLPMVKNRHDPEVEVMKQATDPHAVMDALEKTLADELEHLQQQSSDS